MCVRVRERERERVCEREGECVCIRVCAAASRGEEGVCVGPPGGGAFPCIQAPLPAPWARGQEGT